MASIFLKSFYVAGFTYYQGAIVFGDMKIGSRLEIKLDENNVHDDNAVELRFNGQKIGYLPREENQEVAVLLKAGYKIFESVVQQLSPEAHPEQQVRAALYVIEKSARKK